MRIWRQIWRKIFSLTCGRPKIYLTKSHIWILFWAFNYKDVGAEKFGNKRKLKSYFNKNEPNYISTFEASCRDRVIFFWLIRWDFSIRRLGPYWRVFYLYRGWYYRWSCSFKFFSIRSHPEVSYRTKILRLIKI